MSVISTTILPCRFIVFLSNFNAAFVIAVPFSEAFENFPLMINRAPKLVLRRIYFHEHFIQMPVPIRMSTKFLNPFSSDLRGAFRAKMVPPEPHPFVADINATSLQQNLICAVKAGTGQSLRDG